MEDSQINSRIEAKSSALQFLSRNLNYNTVFSFS